MTIEEIIGYVTATKLDAETSDLLAKVNGHIRKCSACKEKLHAFESVNSALLGDYFEDDSETEVTGESYENSR